MLGVRSKLLQVSNREGNQFCLYPINFCIMPQCWAGEAQVEMKLGDIYGLKTKSRTPIFPLHLPALRSVSTPPALAESISSSPLTASLAMD